MRFVVQLTSKTHYIGYHEDGTEIDSFGQRNPVGAEVRFWLSEYAVPLLLRSTSTERASQRFKRILALFLHSSRLLVVPFL